MASNEIQIEGSPSAFRSWPNSWTVPSSKHCRSIPEQKPGLGFHRDAMSFGLSKGVKFASFGTNMWAEIKDSNRHETTPVLRESRIKTIMITLTLATVDFGTTKGLGMTCNNGAVDRLFTRSLWHDTEASCWWLFKWFKLGSDSDKIGSASREGNCWYSVEGLQRLRSGPESVPHDPHPFQLECTVRMLDGQDILCLSTRRWKITLSCINHSWRNYHM